MKLFVASMSLLLGLSGLARLSAGSAGPALAPRSAEASAVRAGEAAPDEGSYTCPRIWVCDQTEFYDTLVACGLLGVLALANVDAADVVAPAAQTAAAPDLAGPAVDLDGSETSAICPQKWTCNYRNWYGTEENCNASCGGPCFLDYRCTVGCVCP